MINPLVVKLERANQLDDAARKRLDHIVEHARRVGADVDIVKQGGATADAQLIVEGLAACYKDLPNGRRQITAVLVPGDFCALHAALLDRMDHGIRTVTACKVVRVTFQTVEDLTSNHPAIARALWWATLVNEATLREWLLNMGQRQADQQMAHFFCEMLIRLQTVGLATEDSYDLPLTQEELGQILGLSGVHVNRTVGELRDHGLIVWHRGRLTIRDVPQLRAFCDFDPIYLHLERRGEERPWYGMGL